MNDAMQDSEKVEIEDDVQKAPVQVEDEPDTAALAAVEREEKEKEATEDYEDFAMDARASVGVQQHENSRLRRGGSHDGHGWTSRR